MIVVLGGAGFIGLNIAEAALGAGHDVTVLDARPVRPDAAARFAGLPGRFASLVGDAGDEEAVAAAIRPGTDAVVLGAAITADAARDAREPAHVLQTNLVAPVRAVARARDVRVRRVLNLSSAAAYGRAGTRAGLLREDTAPEPESLYAITKQTSEQVLARLGSVWGLDTLSVRLSAAFGPWEHRTGKRDTPSPLLAIAELADAGRPAILPRPAVRDWIYGPDVAAAVLLLLRAERLGHRLYNVSSPERWSALEWGGHLAGSARPGFACRLAEPGESPTVVLHDAADRSPLGTDRLRDEFGWTAAHGCAASAEAYRAWRADLLEMES